MQEELKEKIKELQDICKNLNDDQIYYVIDRLHQEELEKVLKKVNKIIRFLK